jgi:hypothetical protein
MRSRCLCWSFPIHNPPDEDEAMVKSFVGIYPLDLANRRYRKSRWAHGQDDPGQTHREKNNKWWCGYVHGVTMLVVMEDWPAYPGSSLVLQDLRIWGHRDQFNGDTKRSPMVLLPGFESMGITSNDSIRECFNGEQNVRALKRRCCQIGAKVRTMERCRQLTGWSTCVTWSTCSS